MLRRRDHVVISFDGTGSVMTEYNPTAYRCVTLLPNQRARYNVPPGGHQQKVYAPPRIRRITQFCNSFFIPADLHTALVASAPLTRCRSGNLDLCCAVQQCLSVTEGSWP